MHGQDEELILQKQLLSNLIVMGRVTGTDYREGTGLVRVRIGEDSEKSAEFFIPWLRQRGGNDWEWWAPEVGEQVLILAPDGNLNRAVIAGCLPYPGKGESVTPAEKGQRWVLAEGEKEPPPDARDKTESSGYVRHYEDGTTFSYDKKKHLLLLSLLKEKTITLKVDATQDKEKLELSVNNVKLKADSTKDKESLAVSVKDVHLNIEAAQGKEAITLDVKKKAKLVMTGKDITLTTAQDVSLKLDHKGNVSLGCKKLSLKSEGEVAVSGKKIALTGNQITLNC